MGLGAVTGAVLGATVHLHLHLHSHLIGVGPGALVGALGGVVVVVLTLIGSRQPPDQTGTRGEALIRASAPFAVLATAALVYPVLRVAGS